MSSLFAFLLAFFQLIDREAVCTWYGEEFIGRRHAASWHQQTPIGFPEVVTLTHFGIAAPPDIPFGTRLFITRSAPCNPLCSQEYNNTSIIVTVVDRKASLAQGSYDLWPAAAKALGFGPSFEGDVGCIKIRVIAILDSHELHKRSSTYLQQRSMLDTTSYSLQGF